jgi:hypothetical protein
VNTARDLLEGLPEPSPSDLEALRNGRRGASLSPRDYLDLLESLRSPRADELRRRPRLDGEPFSLPEAQPCGPSRGDR